MHTLARISLEEMGASCFALGIVATDFLESPAFVFLAALTLISAFLLDLAIAGESWN